MSTIEWRVHPIYYYHPMRLSNIWINEFLLRCLYWFHFYETQTEVTILQLNRGQQFNSKATNWPKIVKEKLEINCLACDTLCWIKFNCAWRWRKCQICFMKSWRSWCSHFKSLCNLIYVINLKETMDTSEIDEEHLDKRNWTEWALRVSFLLIHNPVFLIS